jgi:hypothetical protein
VRPFFTLFSSSHNQVYPVKIDFLFIDGDHRYSGVKKDWKLYSPLVKRNGLIVFHDILPHPKVPLCKVDKLWNEIKNNYKHREFIDRHDDRGWGQWGGIGAIYYDNESVEKVLYDPNNRNLGGLLALRRSEIVQCRASYAFVFS